jgi:hypothetical protein
LPRGSTRLQLLKFHLQGDKLSPSLLGAYFSLAGFLLQRGEPCLVIRKLASHLLLILEVCLQSLLHRLGALELRPQGVAFPRARPREKAGQGERQNGDRNKR